VIAFALLLLVARVRTMVTANGARVEFSVSKVEGSAYLDVALGPPGQLSIR
jgi:hypothetical protein